MNRNLLSKPGPSHHLKSPVSRPFKSPVTLGKSRQARKSTEEKQTEVEALRKELALVKAEIAELEDLGFKEEELQEHISKLHEYNEVKDAASSVLGRIAVYQGVQTKDVYPKYGLELTD